MTRNEHIFEFSPVLFDTSIIEHKFNNLTTPFTTYFDPRGAHTGFNLNKVEDFEYAHEMCKEIGIVGRPRFYLLDENVYLVPHVDFGTLCSINILLFTTENAPVNVEGNEYTYTSCILNTQKEHSVQNGLNKRILFKISIFEHSYEEVCEKIKLYEEKIKDR
jgi:hypothetical protein|tara:strand:- start:146 stop:631 length:486 start_codon:yes stop_codon:yes gene_type:complete